MREDYAEPEIIEYAPLSDVTGGTADEVNPG
jgi:hypothetical protein